jgi:hypothetical protein
LHLLSYCFTLLLLPTVTFQPFSHSYIPAVYPPLHGSCTANVTLQLFSHCYIPAVYPQLHSSCSATLTFQLFAGRYTAAVQPLLHSSCLSTVTLQLFSHSYIPAVCPPLHCSCTATVTFQLFIHSYTAAVQPLLHSSCLPAVTLQLYSHCYMAALHPLLIRSWAVRIICSAAVTAQLGLRIAHTAIHAQSPTQNDRKRSLLSSITFYIARGLVSTYLLGSARPIFNTLKYLHVGLQLNRKELERRSSWNKN